MVDNSTPYIGRSVRPHKTSRFLTGGGVYVSDIRLPNMLHAALLRSTRAHARIHNIDVREALQMNGVAGVWTGRDIENRIGFCPRGFKNPSRTRAGGGKPVLGGAWTGGFGKKKIPLGGGAAGDCCSREPPQRRRCGRSDRRRLRRIAGRRRPERSTESG